MKNLFLIIALLTVSNLIAQNTYESPYVKGGKSIKMTLPVGYSKIGDEQMPGNDAFAKNPTSSINEFMQSRNQDVFMVLILDDPDGITSPLNFFEKEIKIDPQTKVIMEPVPMITEGGAFLTTVLTLSQPGFTVENMNMAITTFENKFITIMYIPETETGTASIHPKFKDFISSYTVYETTRENTFELTLSREDDVFFENSEFETTLSYEVIFFEAEDDYEEWDEFEDSDVEKLLISYTYKRIEDVWITEGALKVFSAGRINQYEEPGTKVLALDKVFPQHMFRKLTPKKPYSIGELEITEYSFLVGTKSSSKVHSVYSTTFKDEILFIVVEKTLDVSAEFDVICKQFISTMWIWDENAFVAVIRETED